MNLKNTLLAIVAAAVLYIFWNGNNSNRISGIDTPAGQYVYVYGRDSCGYTQKMRRQLERAGISYRYKDIDDQQIADGLHNKMRSAGVNTRRYNLPVVEVNAYILVRPDIGDVIDRY